MFNNLSFTSYLDKPRLHSMFCEPLEADDDDFFYSKVNPHYNNACIVVFFTLLVAKNI